MTKDEYKNSIELVIFDLDETLIQHKQDGIYMHTYIEPILQYLKSNNIIIALASYNPSACKILYNLDIGEYFDMIESEYWEMRYDFKEYMLKKIIEKTRVDINKILFIDDNYKMINTYNMIKI